MFANPIARTSCAITLALALAFAVRVGGADAQQPSPAAIATAKELITVKGAAASAIRWFPASSSRPRAYSSRPIRACSRS